MRKDGLIRRSCSMLATVLVAATMVATAPAQDLEADAAAAIQAGQWQRAAQLYSQLTSTQPENPVFWQRFGQATLSSGGDATAARKAFEKALELGFPPPPARLGIARSHLAEGDAAAAIGALEALAEQGPSPFVIAQLAGDEAFAALAEETAYQAVVQRLTPCASPEYRQFDFWLGNWKVVSPSGQHLGDNVVAETMDGCVLTESWTSARGGQKGLSINYYDRDKGTWSQIYRDNTGNVTQWPELIGGLVEGAMVLESAPGAEPRSRWIWTPQDDGRVRQMAETSTDGGETWTIVWDSYYQRIAD